MPAVEVVSQDSAERYEEARNKEKARLVWEVELVKEGGVPMILDLGAKEGGYERGAGRCGREEVEAEELPLEAIMWPKVMGSKGKWDTWASIPGQPSTGHGLGSGDRSAWGGEGCERLALLHGGFFGN